MPHWSTVGLHLAVVAADFGLNMQPNPRYAINLTLFHEYPPEFEALGLVNQDTGDLLGDAYFAMRGFMLPVECASGDPTAKFDCDNPEQNASDVNIVSQHLVTVDSRFGPYGACNERDGTYSCTCGLKPCGPRVGQADVYTRETPPPPGSADWRWWRVNLARKTGGKWYSTHEAGACTELETPGALEMARGGGREGMSGGALEMQVETPGALAPRCTWNVALNARKITSRCLLSRIATAVVAHNTTCFNACPQPSNLSSTCWVDCFMATSLGPAGGTRLIDAETEGIDIQVIERAWLNAFAPVSAGGCPNAYGARGLVRTDEPTVEEAIRTMLHHPGAPRARLGNTGGRPDGVDAAGAPIQ